MAQPPLESFDRPPSASQAEVMHGAPVPFSAYAIASLVLSLIGCLGLTAVFGLIFGIVGISATRGGVRRGRGLAIAAIPISVVTGLISVVMAMLLLATSHTMQVAMALPEMYDVDGKVSAESLASFRDVCTESFNAEVSEQELTTWFQTVREKYGALTEVDSPGQPTPIPDTDRIVYTFPGKFVSGTESIEVTARVMLPVSFKIDDIAINDSSPRPSH